MPDLPLVSIVTPTYNRRRFIPSLIKMVQTQTYPRDRMEWIVFDDGQEEVVDLFEQATSELPTLKFIWSEDKMTLGEKRNRLNQEARGDIIVAMDDDDFYFPERVEEAVKALQENPGYRLAGSSEVYMYFTDTREIWKAGPYFKGHATNGTMAWTKSYADTHQYDETVAFSEEKSFLEGYKNPLVQLNPKTVMLVMSHSDNTFDKTELRTKTNPLLVKTNLKMKDFIKDPELFNFFSTL
ncbi:MAG: glycosyltransferase family 2 protein [Alphaproteobacteria bacterium]|nr:glycosyltransferase family 2 protein [Alphaproteobacteria bacterium]